jgi:tRNA(Ile)-lysidine synthase TilS/MesJ
MVDFQKIDWFVVGISGGKDSTAVLLYQVKKEFPEGLF